MSFFICPRLKRAKAFDGRFAFSALRVYTVGGGERFFRTLRALCPALPITEAPFEEANVVLSVATVFSSRAEHCAFRILGNRAEIHCHDEGGARNAAAIFAQLIRREAEGWSLPCGQGEDWPDASYRAMMLESSGRSWLSMDRILLYIRQMALARMNVLQFHFMEGPGCTIALDCYPDWHGYGEENLKYTKDEIRAMIVYADELGITVTPFVEVLSHSVTFNQTAGIGCPGDAPPHMFAVCLGQEKTFRAIDRVLAEVAELFPDPVIHIGADEYDMSAVTPRTVYWDKCPHCRALAKEKGYTTLREMFFYGIERINRTVNRLGKVAMMWNADLKPGEIPDSIARNIVIHFYRSDNILGREMIFDLWPNGYAEDGFAVLNSYFPDTYLDLPRYVKAEKVNGWSYLDSPRTSPENRPSVIGGCACAWDKYAHYERTISPAIFLFGDRLWNAEQSVPYDRAYQLALTRVLFEGKLPENVNVFDAVGDVLPPLENANLFHKNKLVTPPEVIERVRDALLALAAHETDKNLATLASIYADVATAALAYREEALQNTDPLKKSIPFEG
ncbi:MAG: family 20 glycosylhydrolase [Clostridia bacterium]|nr:family 20 glycosylhydrolase [Clostridia bacterium]